MRSIPAPIVSTLCIVALVGCPKRVGSQSNLDAATQEKVAEAKRQVDSGVPQDNQSVADVLFQVAEGQFTTHNYPVARNSYRDLLASFPLFDKADLAKYHLALSQLELKEPRDALQTLTTLWPRVAEPDRPEAAAALARAAEGSRAFTDAVKWRAELIKLAHDEATLAAEQRRVFDLVETRVPFLDVARLAQELPADSPVWPLVQFKLAKIFAHLRDRVRMKETLELFLSKTPASPYAAEAKAMLERAERHAQAKPDTLGVVLPLSGKYKSFGEAVMSGIQLALAESKVKLVVKDSAGEVAQARAAVAALAQEDQVLGIIGPVLTGESADAAAEAELQETPIVTLTRSEGITDAGSFVFRNMLTNSAQARALADWATRVKGYKTFAVLYPNIPYGNELTSFFWDEIESKDGEMRGAETYAADETTYSRTVKKLVGRYDLDTRWDHVLKKREIIDTIKDPFRQRKALEDLVKKAEPIIDFEALLIPDSYKNIGLVAPALAMEDIVTNACDKHDIEKIAKTQGKEPRDIKTVQLLGSNMWNFTELVERGGKFVQCAVFVDGFFIGSDRKETQDFVANFRKATGKDPALLEAEGYDTARILRAIIEGPAPQSRVGLREALLKVKDFPGATGRTTVSPKREFEKPLFMLTIDRDQIREIDADAKS